MATSEEIEAAEAKAAHAAGEAFARVLVEELEKLAGDAPDGGVGTIMSVLRDTTHVHTMVVDGAAKGVIRYTFMFSDSPEAVREAVARARRGIG
jgi:hypothetical protein